MDLDALRLFCDVVRRRSFSRGAEIHHLTQPAASQTIQHLEAEMGVLLINRKRRPLLLTPEGEIFYTGCKRLLKDFRDVESRLRSTGHEVSGTVRLAVIYSVGLHNMEQYFQNFMSWYPKARIRAEFQHPDRVLDAVLEDDADLGILSYVSSSKGLVVIPYIEEAMVLACRKTHPLDGKGPITVQSLKQQEYVAFSPELAIRKALDKELRKNRVQVNVIMEFDNVENIKEALVNTDAVSILPESALHREVAAGILASIPLAFGPITRPLSIIHRSQKLLTPAMTKFVEGLRTNASFRERGLSEDRLA